MRLSQRKHIYAAHRIIHEGIERALADLALHQEAAATEGKEDSPAGTASTAPSGTAAGASAADSTHPATAADELEDFHKDPTAIPQPPRTEDEWGEFPFPSVIWVRSMARESEAHYIYFFRTPWMEKPLSPFGCPSCYQQCCPGTILYTFWYGSSLQSLPILLWTPLADFSLLII